MLSRERKVARRGILLGAACACVLSLASLPARAESKPEPTAWEELRDHPVNYDDYPKRRAENLKHGAAGTTQALGEGYANSAELGAGTVVVNDAQLEQRFQAELKKLLPERLGIKPPPIEFIIVDDLGLMSRARAMEQDPETLKTLTAKAIGNFNATSTRGGAIVLPLGTLVATKSVDEIDFLIAHEASHILYDHFDALETREAITKIASVALLVASLVNRDGSSNTAKKIAWSAIGLELANQLLGPAWSRSQEYEADELGFELTIEAGLSQDGAMTVLDHLITQEAETEKALDAMCGPEGAFENTLKDTIFGGVLGRQAPRSGSDPYNPVCQVRHDLLGDLIRSHPHADDRKKALLKINEKFYKGLASRALSMFVDDKGHPADNFLQFASPNGDANRSIQAYAGIRAATSHDMTTARAIAKAISRGSNETLVPVLVLNFHVANADGKREQALGFLKSATLAPQAQPWVFDMTAGEFERDKRYAEAAQVIELWQRRLGHPEESFPRLITDWRLAGQEAKADKALEACNAAGEMTLRVACEAARHPPPPGPPGAPGTPGAPGAPAAEAPRDRGLGGTIGDILGGH